MRGRAQIHPRCIDPGADDSTTVLAMDGTFPPSPHSTFLFADIAGFTALTEAHGDEDAADLALDFCERVRQILRPEQGEVVKTIGDAVMVRIVSPAHAVELGLTIANDLMADHGHPTIRVGMHTGAATERSGDYFGAAVNLAARIAGAAAGGEVLVSEAVHRSARPAPGVVFVSRGRHRVRNIARPVELYAAERAHDAGRPVRVLDPVCHMAMVPGQEAGRLAYRDVVYLFCSEECEMRFAADPGAYAADASAPLRPG